MPFSNMRVMPRAAATAIAAISTLGICETANASIIQYNSRATFDALGPFTPVDWGVFGPAGTGISTPDTRTVGPITVRVASSQGVLDRRDEGTDFTGTFALGDHLLTDADSESDSFIVGFDSPVRGFGTQIDSHFIIGPYTGSIEVFSPTNVLLFTANFSGNNTQAEDNSAPFVGVESNAKNIGYAAYLIDQTDPNIPPKSGALAINTLDVSATVPEPSSLALIASGLLGFLGLGLMKRKAARA